MRVFANLDKIKDSARELVKSWADYGLCELKPSPDDHIWMEEVGKICLFDLTVFKNLNQRAKDAELIILGNKDLGEELLPNMVHGIFWARHPIGLENYLQSYGRRFPSDRKGFSCGIFGYENPTQYERRSNPEWEKQIDLFSLSRDTKKFKPFEYLDTLAGYKFGLDLLGTGQRCNRIVELCALGTVPVLPSDYYVNFHNPFLDGDHFISCNEPKELRENLKQISKGRLFEMSEKAIQFYEDNFSPEGSFNTIQEIISNNK